MLEAIGLGDATWSRVSPTMRISPRLLPKYPALAAGGAHFVLTGKAQSIQHVSRALKTAGVGRRG